MFLMLTIFRKIRKNLADDNKPLKYLRYAFGEILLVVVGIMIALQINNWNEERKQKLDEINTLYNLREKLTDDIPKFDLSMVYVHRAGNSMQILLSWMEEDKPYQDSLRYHFGNTNSLITPNINISPFKSLESKNLSLISNPDLRQQIILFYGSGYYVSLKLIEEYRAIVIDASGELYADRFDEFWKVESDSIKTNNKRNDSILTPVMEPIDFEKLKKDREYLYFLKSLKNRHYYLLEENIEMVFDNMKRLIAEIDEELTILENK